jgi:Family of unknown function (DUF6069)
MAVPDSQYLDGHGTALRLNVGRLWAGGIATAVVAVLVVVAGVFIARHILGIAVLAPKAAGDFGSGSTVVYAAVAAAAALLATALLHVLLLGAPRPLTFFAWITGLADLIAVAAPFAQAGPQSGKVATAVINLVTGVAIISLLSGTARGALQPVRTATPGAGYGAR